MRTALSLSVFIFCLALVLRTCSMATPSIGIRLNRTAGISDLFPRTSYSATEPHHQAVNMNPMALSKSQILRATAISATAIGAAAVGAFAIGAAAVGGLAIGALAVRKLAIRGLLGRSAKFKSLEIQNLTVTRLRAGEVIVTDTLKAPGSTANPSLS